VTTGRFQQQAPVQDHIVQEDPAVEKLLFWLGGNCGCRSAVQRGQLFDTLHLQTLLVHPVVDVGLQVELELQAAVGLELVLGLGADHLGVGALLGVLEKLGAVGPGDLAGHAAVAVLVEVTEHVVG